MNYLLPVITFICALAGLWPEHPNPALCQDVLLAPKVLRSQAAAAKLYEFLFQIPDSAGLKQPEVLKAPLVRAIFPLAGGSQTQKSVRISGFPQTALKLQVWHIFGARLCPVFAALLGLKDGV